MRILVLGGYGVFGGRLCQLLAPDTRLSLMVAGRSYETAKNFCQALPEGAYREPLLFDRNANAEEQIARVRPDVVIDASGPFQAYGTDPYCLVKACLANSVNYMDFADGSDFVKGVCQFDAEAKEKNLFVLSGVSSFPVLTAAVVRKLSTDYRRIKSIRGGIAPSPFAGVGMNVIRAISAYAGKRVALVRDGKPAFAYALTEATRFTISPPGRLPLNNTRFSLVDVPDLQVLPELWPKLDDIWMGSGPVPEILHRMLSFLAWLVRLRILPSLSAFAPLFYHAVNMLRWGEHRGGMFVEVTGVKENDEVTTRSWHLIAEGSDGPFIPCMALEAIIWRILSGNKPIGGARPASGDLELGDYERLFKLRTIYTGERENPRVTSAFSIFQNLLDSAWDELPKPIQDMHIARGEIHSSGLATVERGNGVLANMIANLFRFPTNGNDVKVEVSIKQFAGVESWRRTFNGYSFSSILCLGKGKSDKLLCEKFGPFTVDIALIVDEGKLRFIVRKWRIWRIPLPRAWAPGGDSFEYVADGRFCFNVEIKQPLVGMIVKYSGWIIPNGE